jgi:predicted Fe-Mo cluster-binding NifX family protein
MQRQLAALEECIDRIKLRAIDQPAMKIAIPEWRGRVSPVFDVAEQILLVDLDEKGVGHRQTVYFGNSSPHERARRLTDLAVDVILCGAISWSLDALLVAGGIRVIPLLCGEVEEVIEAFRDGLIEEARFAMPGCCSKTLHARHRQGEDLN